jgi:di/tricarboxylate transporter
VAADFPGEGLAVAVAEPGETVLSRVAKVVRTEPVLVLSFTLAALSMIGNPPSRTYLAYMDFKVLGCLFALMAVVAGFRSIGVFEHLSVRMLSHVKSVRQVSLVLVALTFFSSMWITNDVALITFVPFAFVVFGMLRDTRPVIITVVLQTVAANVGSSLTPMGNPQNLYLFSYYDMPVFDFFMTMLPLVTVGAVVLAIFLIFIGGKNEPVVAPDASLMRPVDRKAAAWLGSLFLLSILAVFDVVPWFTSRFRSSDCLQGENRLPRSITVCCSRSSRSSSSWGTWGRWLRSGICLSVCSKAACSSSPCSRASAEQRAGSPAAPRFTGDSGQLLLGVKTREDAEH